MTNFECCKGKLFPSSYYICTDCFKVYHKSCVLKNKSKYTFSAGFKIKCCESAETTSSQSLILEKNILEETIQELTESSQAHENYWKKIKTDYDTFLAEATEREQELTDFIQKQSDQIKKYSVEIKKLEDLISDFKDKTFNSRSTQTNQYDYRRNSTYEKEIGTQTDKQQDFDASISKRESLQNNRNVTQEFAPEETLADQPNNILLVAGNHGKNLVSFIISYMGKCAITAIIKPNANNEEIIDSAVSNSELFSKKDVVLLWPNNMNISQFNNLNSRLQHTNFIILSTPYRYDNLEENRKIYHYNLSLNKMVHLATRKLKQVINVNAILRKTNYCRVGYNINNIGKKYIAKYIVNKIKEMKLCGITMNQTRNETGEISMEKLRTREQQQETSSDADRYNALSTESSNNFLYPRLSQMELL